jgi:chromosomal replication initiator protein
MGVRTLEEDDFSKTTETPEQIVIRISAKYHAKPEHLRGQLRHPHLVKARKEVYLILREMFHWSYPVIGKFMNRDHTSIIHAIGKRRDGKNRNEVKIEQYRMRVGI